jgi:signal transduction histidine kinase/CheY-like chemotaxis protein
VTDALSRFPTYLTNKLPVGTLTQAGILTGVFIAYAGTAWLGFQFETVNGFAAYIWPPAGIALSAFLLYGNRVAIPVSLAAFFVNLAIGAPLLGAIVIAVGNTIGPYIGAFFIRWYSNYSPTQLWLDDNIGIVATAVFVPAITASLGVGSLWLTGAIPLNEFNSTWSTWWMGDALGIIVIAPFVLKWIFRPFFVRTPLQYLELALVELSVIAFSLLIFFTPNSSFAYGVFIPLTWTALRTGPRGATLAVLVMSVIAILGTTLGRGPFATEGLQELQIFIATVAAVIHVFTAVVEERKRVHRSMEEHAGELEAALHKISSEDEAKKEFIAILAHELRNPLATILTSVELLQLEKNEGAQIANTVETVGERARAMVRMLDDLLDVSRISQKKLKLKKENISVDDVIDNVSHNAEPIIRGYGHSFTVTKPDQPLYLEADPLRLEQIFINLITNAAKYTKPRGRIELTAHREDSMAVFTLKDSGIGIPKNMLQQIFEPFFQINRGQSSRDGLGIGLPLTRQLVDMHGGSIEARSGGTGAGSEFVVKLPLTERMLRAPLRDAGSHGARHIKNSHRILLVDDNKASIDALSRLLELRGHTTAVVYEGKDAVPKALEFDPDVVFLDIGLPDIDGYQVAAQLKRLKKPFVLIALTGYGQDEDKQRAKDAGFEHHLTKPAGLKSIEALLRKVPAPRPADAPVPSPYARKR